MKIAHSGTPIRTPQIQGTPWNGPIQIGGRVAEHMVQVGYNAQHKIPWHWPVPAYLVTKGIGAGLFMFLSLALGLGLISFDRPTFLVGGFIALLFTAITTGLLVYDLEKPERFFSIVFRPQWKSWLARGAYLLIGFSGVAGLWWLSEAAIALGWFPESLGNILRPLALWLGLPLAGGVAVYTAFLFGQAEGRDLWQNSLLPIHLLVQALMVGSAVLLVMPMFLASPAGTSRLALLVFTAALLIDLLVTLIGEFGMPHASEVAARAAHAISHGHYRVHFWWGSLALGHLLPLLLVITGLPVAAALAGLAAIVGLFFHEYAFVMAPQEIPNS